MNKTKKVLLLNPPGNKKFLRDCYCSHISKGSYYWPPYDLLAISGILSDSHNLFAIDCIAQNIKNNECIEIIQRINPDNIIFLTGVVSRKYDELFIKEIKITFPNVKIALTGDFLLEEKELYFKCNDYIDAIFLDFTCPEILDYINDNLNKSICNLLIRDKEIDLNYNDNFQFSIGLPRHDLFNFKYHSLPHMRRYPLATIMTALGCPFACYFCQQENVKYKMRELKEVFAELDYFHTHNYKEIWFKDLSFGTNEKHYNEICNYLIEKKYNFSWSCEIRADTISENKLELMRKAGCHSVFIGVETPNEKVLASFNKKIPLITTINAFDLCKKYGIKTIAHFIIGLPGETEQTIKELIDFAIKLDPHYCAFNIATPAPNSTFKKLSMKNNWIDSKIDTYDNSISFPILNTETLKAEKLWKLKKDADKKFYFRVGYIFKQLKEINSVYEISNKLKNLYNYFCHHF
ncbi:MAG: radical SAM protein [uncultured bacterium]|nr:MAG: radical SAM protein [uncultured bacterium]